MENNMVRMYTLLSKTYNFATEKIYVKTNGNATKDLFS